MTSFATAADRDLRLHHEGCGQGGRQRNAGRPGENADRDRNTGRGEQFLGIVLNVLPLLNESLIGNKPLDRGDVLLGQLAGEKVHHRSSRIGAVRLRSR